MPDSHHRMMKDHPRAGIAHHLTDLFSHLRLITMNLTVAAKSLVLHKRAFIATQPCVVTEFFAFRTKFSTLCSVILSAIKGDHFTDSLFLTFTLFLRLIHEIRPPSIANVFSAILMVDSL